VIIGMHDDEGPSLALSRLR